MRALGSRYCNGQGVPRDTPEGIRWYRLAAAAGSAEAAADLKRLGLAPEI
jgi:TPR repeat protein